MINSGKGALMRLMLQHKGVQARTGAPGCSLSGGQGGSLNEVMVVLDR